MPAPQLWGDSAKETEKVCQSPSSGDGGLGPSSRLPVGGVQGGQELGASGGSLGSGSQSREYSAEDTGEVSQGRQAPGGLPSASCHPLLGLQGCQELVAWAGVGGAGASGDSSAGSGPQPKGDSADEKGEVCQGSGELPSVTCQGFGTMQGGQELGPSGGSMGSGSHPLGDSLEKKWGEGSARSPAGLCLLLAPLAAAGVSLGFPGVCAPAQGRPRGRHRGGLPGPRGASWAALCLASAHPIGAGLAGAGGLRGLAWFGAPAQGRPRQRDQGGMPGTRGAAVWEQTAAGWAARLAGCGGIGGLPRLCVPAHGRLHGRDRGGLPGPWQAGLCLLPAPLAAAGVPVGLPGLCTPARGGGDSAEDVGEVCQGPSVPGGLAYASHQWLGRVQGGQEPRAMGEPREDPGPAPGRLGAQAHVSCAGRAQGPTSLGTVAE